MVQHVADTVGEEYLPPFDPLASDARLRTSLLESFCTRDSVSKVDSVRIGTYHHQVGRVVIFDIPNPSFARESNFLAESLESD